MAVRGMIFDIDGTLVDTNPAHVEAWHRAFQRLGYDVPPERIELEIRKGGDLLVPSILGEDLEERYGDLFQALHEREIRVALATSNDEKHLRATMASARARPDHIPRRTFRGHQRGCFAQGGGVRRLAGHRSPVRRP